MKVLLRKGKNKKEREEARMRVRTKIRNKERERESQREAKKKRAKRQSEKQSKIDRHLEDGVYLMYDISYALSCDVQNVNFSKTAFISQNRKVQLSFQLIFAFTVIV